MPVKMDEKTYRGLVPMFPFITPNAEYARDKVDIHRSAFTGNDLRPQNTSGKNAILPCPPDPGFALGHLHLDRIFLSVPVMSSGSCQLRVHPWKVNEFLVTHVLTNIYSLFTLVSLWDHSTEFGSGDFKGFPSREI